MTTLFEPVTINSMTIANRTMRSATWEGMCDPDGRPTRQLIDCYRELAQGGVGLIISGYAFVLPHGRQAPAKLGLHDDRFEPEYRALFEAVHDAGGKIAVQLVHAGGQTTTEAIGRQPLAPSAVKLEQFPEEPAELTVEQIGEIVAAFGQAARRARDWGADAVQLHGAHGYLINQFLSPLANRRTDNYGGGIENRARFALECYHAAREAVGADFPVMIKLNSADNLEGGLDLRDAIRTAGALVAEGLDHIEVSGGTAASGGETPVRTKIDAPDKEAYHLDNARAIRDAVDCAVGLVGGMRSPDVCERAVGEGFATVSFARPLIREPDLVGRWQQGDLRPATCISCNGCFGPATKGEGIYCVVDKEEHEDATKLPEEKE
jgi:2,4-dienoyl-CoA reductase-like NADH-dependent reductase (Old Yellow Enzyme family)